MKTMSRLLLAGFVVAVVVAAIGLSLISRDAPAVLVLWIASAGVLIRLYYQHP